MLPIRSTQQQLFERLLKHEVYLYYDFEDVCFRVQLDKDKEVISYTKFKNSAEFLTHKQSGIFAEALRAPHEITKIDYENF